MCENAASTIFEPTTFWLCTFWRWARWVHLSLRLIAIPDKTWSRINCNWETKADFLLKEWPRGKKSSSGFSYLLSQLLFQIHFFKTLLWSQISSCTLSHILLILLVSSLSNQTPEKSFFVDRCVTIRLHAFQCKQVHFELQLTVIHFELEMAA